MNKYRRKVSSFQSVNVVFSNVDVHIFFFKTINKITEKKNPFRYRFVIGRR